VYTGGFLGQIFYIQGFVDRRDSWRVILYIRDLDRRDSGRHIFI
jgi:hypothetical protein